ncbi:nuclear transport factor 2 family protein [Kosakonia cowanii]|uniref:nuclear transport factor 2 family protein n=1 Tax=Kosakonia cowanii TaxID=208223 RepID=UPI0028AB32B8|nr:nuclear transport factor 2 family protein [Kosakonia cowanii]
MSTTYIEIVLDEILNQQKMAINEITERYFNPSYRQRTNGCWGDLKEFAHHAHKLREIVVSARIEVLDQLRDGNLYATRHRVLCSKRDGSEVIMEVYMFAETDESGRFLRIEETTMMIKGSESDRDLGSAR